MTDPDPPAADRNDAQREPPSEGLRVLESGSPISGPFATRIVAESGAAVIPGQS